MKKIALRRVDEFHENSHARPHPVNGAGVLSEARRVAESKTNLCDFSGFDNFVEHEGLRFAGTHLILDLWQASNLDNLETVEATLRKATEAAGATLLNIDLHSFTPTGGITGVAVLAESHISIHTWPEHSYAAVDVFMCGEAKPHKAIDVLRRAFAPEKVTLVEHKRGLMP